MAGAVTTNSKNDRQLLLISNSTVFGQGYLDHAEHEIRELMAGKNRIVFLPYALHDRRAYAKKAEERFCDMGLSLTSIHDFSNMTRAVEEADAIFIGGGNTFRLLTALHDYGLLEPIRRKTAWGTPYIGSSAGSIVACPTLKTTKDMPIMQPPSFEALGLVQFQISPHYLDPDSASTHMGETQEERILQFLEENDVPVVGLLEGSMLMVQGKTVTLKGPHTARIFRRGVDPCEAPPGSSLETMLECAASIGEEAA
jgi:dipeptidase E